MPKHKKIHNRMTAQGNLLTAYNKDLELIENKTFNKSRIFGVKFILKVKLHKSIKRSTNSLMKA